MDTILIPLLDDLRACLCARLHADDRDAGCFCGMYPGASAVADFCTCKGGDGCGMAWVRLDRVFPSAVSFPSPDSKPSCTTLLAAVIEVGVRRCAPVPDGRGKMDPVALVNATLTQVRDASAMVEAIRCCDSITKRPHVLGNYLPEPGGGDCLGGTWPVTVQLVRRA